jgi:hypothetical protein
VAATGSVQETFLSCTTLAAAPLRNAFGGLLECSCRTLRVAGVTDGPGNFLPPAAPHDGADQAPNYSCCITQDGALIRQSGPHPPAQASSRCPTLPVEKGEYLLRQSAGSGVLSDPSQQDAWCIAGGGGDSPIRDTPVIAVPVLLGTGGLQEKDEQGVAVLLDGEGNKPSSAG